MNTGALIWPTSCIFLIFSISFIILKHHLPKVESIEGQEVSQLKGERSDPRFQDGVEPPLKFKRSRRASKSFNVFGYISSCLCLYPSVCMTCLHLPGRRRLINGIGYGKLDLCKYGLLKISGRDRFSGWCGQLSVFINKNYLCKRYIILY